MKLRTAIAIVLALSVGAAAQRNADLEWPSFGRDPGAQRYSPLTQLTPRNVAQLQEAWSFDTGATNLQVTPIVVNGLMYVTAGTMVFALEPETGKEAWRFDAKKKVARRGVAYWPGDGTLAPRIFAGVGDGRLMALDAKTGEPVRGFGDAGFVDLKAGIRGTDGPFMLESPPAVYRNVLITGGANTEGEPSLGLYGDIRGWDARSGTLLWTFHTVPRPGEPGVETWEGESWKNRSGTNAWTYMTVDVDRGMVFAATGSPTTDFYGADRKGRNLYGNSLLALDANTGKLVWFQQLVHHDIWDWDLPAAPTLIEVKRNGRTIPAVAQMTKMSTLFIFDRRNGEPVFGIEERPVPQTSLPGEETSPTQPFPLQPAPLARTTFDPATDLYTLTPEHAAYCRTLWDENKMYTKGMFTPPELDRTMVMFPSTLGGGNWSGLSYDAGARPGVHQHHEPRPGGPHGAAHRRGRRPRVERITLRADLALGIRVRTLLESSDEDSVLRAPLRRARRGGRQQGVSRVAGSAWRVRRFENPRVRQDGHPEHRRHHRNRERPRLCRRDDRQTLPGVQCADRSLVVGNDAGCQRARDPDDVHGPRRATVRGRRCQWRRSAAVHTRAEDRRLCAACRSRLREARGRGLLGPDGLEPVSPSRIVSAVGFHLKVEATSWCLMDFSRGFRLQAEDRFSHGPESPSQNEMFMPRSTFLGF